jgi:hypothetical protein
MRHLTYRVRYSVVPINSSLNRNIILLGYNKTRLKRRKIFSSFHDVITEFDCIIIYETSYMHMARVHRNTHLCSWRANWFLMSHCSMPFCCVCHYTCTQVSLFIVNTVILIVRIMQRAGLNDMEGLPRSYVYSTRWKALQNKWNWCQRSELGVRVNWMKLAEDGKKWRSVLNMAMNFRVP